MRNPLRRNGKKLQPSYFQWILHTAKKVGTVSWTCPKHYRCSLASYVQCQCVEGLSAEYRFNQSLFRVELCWNTLSGHFLAHQHWSILEENSRISLCKITHKQWFPLLCFFLPFYLVIWKIITFLINCVLTCGLIEWTSIRKNTKK